MSLRGSRRSSVLYQIHPDRPDLPTDVLKKLSMSSIKHKASTSSQCSEIQDEILAQINASQSTLNDEDKVEQNLQELNFYYGIIKRHLLRYQSAITGLYPAMSSEKKVGSVRDTLYCCMATWSLCQAYKKINDDKGKCYELGQTTVLGLQGILKCWMGQAKLLESFKANQNPNNALHVIFDMVTGGEVESEKEKYPHLQLDVVSLYLLFLVQAIASGLKIIGLQAEVSFVQNLVFYVERAYRTPDFGMWERGSVYNDGTPEVHASSIGMAKAALESINGFNLFGESGASWSVIYVDIDAHNRNRSIFETILPRESGSKECDAALLSSITFPAFATHDEALYKKTKANIVSTLQGNWGFKRFSRDGFGCVLEPKDKKYTIEGMTQKFENVESEWPIFYAFMIIDGVFKNQDAQVEMYQAKLKRMIKYADNGDPMLPMYYYVPKDAIKEEQMSKGSQYRFPSDEGSMQANIFLWGQAMLIISDLLTAKLLSVDEIDPIRRHLPSSTRPNYGARYSTFELTHHQDSIVQVVVISESRRLQAYLSTYGVSSQTPDEVEPVQIWSQWDMVKVYEKLGQSKKLDLSGRPSRPIGALGSSKIYRVSGQTVITYPLTFCSTEFYISHDLALLTDHIRADIHFVSQRWRLRGRPTYCILIKEEFKKDPQFGEFLNLLLEIGSQRLDNIVQCSLGRLQNLLNEACIEHLDFSSSADVNELDIEPFAQVQHGPYETIENIEQIKLAKIHPEDVIDFTDQFQKNCDEEIIHEIHQTENIFKRVQLLGILLQRRGENFQIMAEVTGELKKHN